MALWHSAVKSKVSIGKYLRKYVHTRQIHTGDSLKQFIDDVGVPESMVTDSATEFVGKNTDFVHEARKMRMHLHYSEQGQHKQDHHAEHERGILSMC
eukprot:1924426-Ditylum_brightwellii.AAC.1